MRALSSGPHRRPVGCSAALSWTGWCSTRDSFLGMYQALRECDWERGRSHHSDQSFFRTSRGPVPCLPMWHGLQCEAAGSNPTPMTGRTGPLPPAHCWPWWAASQTLGQSSQPVVNVWQPPLSLPDPTGWARGENGCCHVQF